MTLKIMYLFDKNTDINKLILNYLTYLPPPGRPTNNVHIYNISIISLSYNTLPSKGYRRAILIAGTSMT